MNVKLEAALITAGQVVGSLAAVAIVGGMFYLLEYVFGLGLGFYLTVVPAVLLTMAFAWLVYLLYEDNLEVSESRKSRNDR